MTWTKTHKSHVRNISSKGQLWTGVDKPKQPPDPGLVVPSSPSENASASEKMRKVPLGGIRLSIHVSSKKWHRPRSIHTPAPKAPKAPSRSSRSSAGHLRRANTSREDSWGWLQEPHQKRNVSPRNPQETLMVRGTTLSTCNSGKHLRKRAHWMSAR